MSNSTPPVQLLSMLRLMLSVKLINQLLHIPEILCQFPHSLFLLHLWSIHGSGVTRYHSKMMSGGEEIRFINYIPVLSPHQWPPGTCPSTTSSPPTLEYCHSNSGVVIQCKRPLLYSQWMEIMHDASYRHLCMKYLAIGNSYAQWDRDAGAGYDVRLLNGTLGQMVWKTTVRWIPISLEMHIRQILLVRKDWSIGGIPFARRKFRLTGYQSKGIGGRRNGSKTI